MATLGEYMAGGRQTVADGPAVAAEALSGTNTSGGFRGFVEKANPTLLDYEHVPRLVDVAGRVADGSLSRVLVMLAPRYFKSEIFSRLLPAYYLSRFTRRHVGLASYSASLAWDLSGEARRYFEEEGGETALDTDAKKEWASTHGGKMWADGIGGSLTGKGYHLGIIDDPMKPEHARSRAYIDGFQRWYKSTWYNRREPGGAMILVMQRLGVSDPIDFLFRREVGRDADEAPEGWHVVACDEIKSKEPLSDYDGPRGLPETCTLEPDDRKAGQILAPSRFDFEEVQKQQAAAGVNAGPQRQQRAKKAEGEVWKPEWFEVYGTATGDPYAELPGGTRSRQRHWDTAYTSKKENSASACVEGCLHGSMQKPDCYVTDVRWDWREFPSLLSWMQGLPGPHMIEGKASGKSAIQSLRESDLPVKEVEVKGDKYTRTTAAQPMVVKMPQGEEAQPTGRVYVHASIFDTLMQGADQGLAHVTYEDLRKESGGLDVNDAFVQLITELMLGQKRDLPQRPRSRVFSRFG